MTTDERRTDFLFYVFGTIPATLIAIAAAQGIISERVAIALLSVSFVGLNLVHLTSTWVRVYLTQGYAAEAPLERIVIPVILLVGVNCFEAVGGAPVLLAMQYFLSFHHAIMQNYGLVRISRRREGLFTDERAALLDQAACLLLPLAALAWRARTVASYNTAPVPRPPETLCLWLAGVGIVALVAWLARELFARREWNWNTLLPLGMVFGTNLLWSWLLVALENPLIPMYALASGHYFQYNRIVRQYERRPDALTSLPLRWRQWIDPRSAVRYYAALVFMGGAVFVALTAAQVGLRELAALCQIRVADGLDLPPWSAAILGVNLQHYWLDHRIWRFRNTKSNTGIALQAA